MKFEAELIKILYEWYHKYPGEYADQNPMPIEQITLLAKKTALEERRKVLEEVMEEVAELRFDEWREPIDAVYEKLKQLSQAETKLKEGFK